MSAIYWNILHTVMCCCFVNNFCHSFFISYGTTPGNCSLDYDEASDKHTQWREKEQQVSVFKINKQIVIVIMYLLSAERAQEVTWNSVEMNI